MRNNVFLSVILFAMLIVTVACSSPDPVTPVNDDMPSNEAVQTFHDFANAMNQILMSGTMYIDPSKPDASIVSERSVEWNMDITSLLATGCPGGCFSFRIVGVVGTVLEIELTIENPTSIQVYDVRLIYENTHGKTVLNPDSYTDMFKPWNIRPFTAFAKDDPDRAFPVGPGATDTQTLFLDFPRGAPSHVEYTIVASVPGQTMDVYELSGFEQHGHLTPSGGHALITVLAYDHQDDVTHVVMDTSVITGGLTFLEHVPGPQYQWSKGITNSEGVPAGTYICPMVAISPNPQDIRTFNYFSLTVSDDHFGWKPIEEVHLSADGFNSADPDLAFDQNGKAHIVWTEVEDLGAGQWNYNIWYSNNVEGEWSVPYEVSDAFQNVNDQIVSPSAIAINNLDQVCVVWAQKSGEGELPKLWWNMFDNRNGWMGQTEMFDFTSMETMPHLYSDDHFFYLVFKQGEMSPGVMFSKWDSIEWSHPVQINDPIDMVYEIKLDGKNSFVGASRGCYYVVWSFYDMNPDDIWWIQYTESCDGGWTWTGDSTTICDDYDISSWKPSFAMDNTGNLYAVWGFGTDQIRWDKYDFTTGWGRDLILYEQLGASYPTFDVMSNGYQHVAFVNTEMLPPPLLYMESPDTEHWTFARIISPDEGEAETPSLKVWDLSKVGVTWKHHGGSYSNDILYREKIMR